MAETPVTPTKKAGRAIHACETDGASPEEQDLPPAVAKKPQGDKSPAEWAFERVLLYIRAFEEKLDGEHEVAIGMTGDQSGLLRIEGIGYFDPDILTFYGSDTGGNRAQLIQHVTQLSVSLRAVVKPAGREEPLRIGFRLTEDNNEDPDDGARDDAPPVTAPGE